MKTIAYLLILGGAAWAGPVLNTIPDDGVTSGAPGQVAGWGFAIQPDSLNYVSVIGSFVLFESNPSLGFYTDLVGNFGGPIDGLLPPGNIGWLEPFNWLAGTGLGYYTIDAAAPLGAESQGVIRVLYELFSDDPRTCGDCRIDGSPFLDVPFTVQVAEAVPEPGTLGPVALALVLAVWWGKTKLPHHRLANYRPKWPPPSIPSPDSCK